jgi:hypothetical protein
MFPATSGPDSFASHFFPGLDLGDRRLHRRFERVAQAALEHPEKSLPDKFRDPAGYLGYLRLLHHKAVTHEGLLSRHRVAALDRIERHPGVVLLNHDTTGKSDGLPGWITLWRGWERLHTMLDHELARASCV